MTRCRSCDADIVFVPSAASGKQMILDARPAKGVVIVYGVDSTKSTLLPLPRPIIAGEQSAPTSKPEAKVVDVWTDHHATCPNAKDWR